MKTPVSERGISLHHQISTLIKDGIATGRYHAGDQLPTERVLCELHGVSRVTVRRALQSLEEQGLVERKIGSGTFVSGGSRVLSITTPIAEYMRKIAERRASSRSVVKEFEYVVAPPEVVATLQLRQPALVLRILRLRMAKELPLVHTTTFLPDFVGAHVKRADFGRHSLVEIVKRAGFPYSKIDILSRACLATPEVARWLQVESGSPLVDVQRVGYDKDGRPLEYQRMLGPSDRFETYVSVQG